MFVFMYGGTFLKQYGRLDVNKLINEVTLSITLPLTQALTGVHQIPLSN